MFQIFLDAQGAYKGSIPFYVFFCPFHGRVEISLDFEELAKLHVKNVQLLVQVWVSDQYHLYVQRNRLRSQALRCDVTKAFFCLLYFALFALESPLQSLVRKRISQQFLNWQYQITVVCSVQRSSADHREISYHRADLGFFLNSPKEVLIRRVGFHYHWGSFDLRVVDDNVYLIFLERCFPHPRKLKRSLRSFVWPSYELGQIIQDVTLHAVKESCDVQIVFVFLFQIRYQMAEGKESNVSVHSVEFFMDFPVHIHKLSHCIPKSSSQTLSFV